MGLILTLLGSIVILVGYIWGVVVGFQSGGALWGILNFLFPPITPAIMAIQRKISWNPVMLQMAGFALLLIGPILFAVSFSS